MKHYKYFKDCSQQELDELFQDTIDLGNALYRNFEITLDENYQDKSIDAGEKFENLKDYKKMVEGQFIDHIETNLKVKAFKQDSQQYQFPITKDNFEFNILNVLAKLRDGLHNKMNSKHSGTYDG